MKFASYFSSLSRLADFEGTVAGIRQQFVGVQYNVAHLEESALTFVEQTDENQFWMRGRELTEDPRYCRVEFLLAFDTAGFLLDIEASAYPHSGTPYREPLQIVGEWAIPILELLSRGVIQPVPVDAETEWSLLAGDYAADDKFSDLPVKERHINAFIDQYVSSLVNYTIYRWAMRCLTGATRYPEYVPGDSALLIFLGLTAANRYRHAEAARLLQAALNSERVTLEQLREVSEILAKLGLEGDALSCLFITLRDDLCELTRNDDAETGVDATFIDNERNREYMEDFWSRVEGLLPPLVRGHRWSELNKVLVPLKWWAEMTSEKHLELVTMAGALTRYYSGETEYAREMFDSLASGCLPSLWAQAASGIVRWENGAAAKQAMASLTATFPELPEDSEDSPISHTMIRTSPNRDHWRSLFPSPILSPLDAVGMSGGQGVDREPVTIPVSSLSDGREHVVRVREFPNQGPVRSVLVQVDPDENKFAESVRESYPVADCGIPSQAKVMHLYQFAHCLGGVAKLDGIGDLDLEAFLPYFHEYYDKLKPETVYDFELYGFVEEIESRPDQTFEISDGPLVDILGMSSQEESREVEPESLPSVRLTFNTDSTLMLRDPVRNAVYTLCSKVEAVDWIAFDGRPLCKMVAALAGDTPTPARVTLLAAEHILGDFVPRVGAPFICSVWLHARLVSLDAISSQASQRSSDELNGGAKIVPVASLSFRSEDAQPLNRACQAVKRKLESCNDIENIELLYGGLSVDPELTFLTHDGKRHFVYVRAIVGELENGQDFSRGSDKGKRSHAESHGMTPYYFVDVALKEVPGGDEILYRGLEAIEEMLVRLRKR